MEEELIADAKKFTADTFSHASNTKRENGNAIFTSENIDKSDELVDTVKKLTINNSGYYESNTVTANGAQGDLTPHTSNINVQQKLLSYQTIPILSPQQTRGLTKGLRRLN